MNDFIEQWYLGLELWYPNSQSSSTSDYMNHYYQAMTLWREAFHQYYDDDDDENNNTHPGCIDSLECQWKKVMLQYDETYPIMTFNPTSFNFLQLHLFVAGTCLDAQEYDTARCLLYQLIIHHLLPFIVQSPQHHHPPQPLEEYYQLLSKALQEYYMTYEEEGYELQQQQQQQTHNHQHIHIKHDETTTTVTSWMIGRRIATLRNSLSSLFVSSSSS